MKLEDAETLAIGLMEKQGLNDWEFCFDNAVRRFGACHYQKKLITLSPHLTQLNDESYVRKTILHEIAHALAWIGFKEHGHGRKWKEIANAVRNTPKSCSSRRVTVPNPKFVGICPNCGHTILKNRRDKTACRKCCNAFNYGKFSEEFLFNWIRAR